MFDEKIKSFFENIDFRYSPPQQNTDHYLVDYIEFYSFFYGDVVTKAEVLDLLDDHGVNIKKYFNTYSHSIDENVSEENDGNVSEDNDEKEYCLNQAFNFLLYRSGVIKEDYPFLVDKNSISLKKSITINNKVYLILLFCSMLERFKEFQSILTSDFESISAHALKNMFFGYEIKEFGKRSDYSGSAKDKIISLASDMKIGINNHELNKININNNQEKGLDIVLWQPFSDGIPNMIILLVQCACGKDWYKKTSEVKRYYSYLNFSSFKPNCVLTIPFGLSNNGGFSQSDDVASSEGLLLDRLRIVENITGTNDFNNTASDSVTIFNEIFNYCIKIENN